MPSRGRGGRSPSTKKPPLPPEARQRSTGPRVARTATSPIPPAPNIVETIAAASGNTIDTANSPIPPAPNISTFTTAGGNSGGNNGPSESIIDATIGTTTTIGGGIATTDAIGGDRNNRWSILDDTSDTTTPLGGEIRPGGDSFNNNNNNNNDSVSHATTAIPHAPFNIDQFESIIHRAVDKAVNKAVAEAVDKAFTSSLTDTSSKGYRLVNKVFDDLLDHRKRREESSAQELRRYEANPEVYLKQMGDDDSDHASVTTPTVTRPPTPTVTTPTVTRPPTSLQQLLDDRQPGNSVNWAAIQSNITGAEDRIGDNSQYPNNSKNINAEKRIGDSNSHNAEDRIRDSNSQYDYRGNTNNSNNNTDNRQYNHRPGKVEDNYNSSHDSPNPLHSHWSTTNNRNQIRHTMDKYARDKKISRKNIAALAGFHDRYHGSAMGSPVGIGEHALQHAGFTFNSRNDIYDIVPAYDEIVTIHSTTVTLWPDPNDTTKGPQVHRIITKCLSAFPTLRSTSGRAWVDFYDKLQSSGTNFILPLTPFDSIINVTDYTYLFPPLLGTKRYAACATAMLSLLAYIIPTSLSNTLNVLVNTVRDESGNGYDLLYRALKVFVPGFDKSRPLPLPYWMDGTTVHDFSTSMVLYFRIQALHQMPHSDYDKSLSFLRGITGSEYTELTHSLISTVENFYLDNLDGELGWLPERLRIPGLAVHLNDFAVRRMTAENQYLATDIVPFARRVAGHHPHNLPFDVSYPEAPNHSIQYSNMSYQDDSLIQPYSHRTFSGSMDNNRQSRGGVRFQNSNHSSQYSNIS